MSCLALAFAAFDGQRGSLPGSWQSTHLMYFQWLLGILLALHN